MARAAAKSVSRRVLFEHLGRTYPQFGRAQKSVLTEHPTIQWRTFIPVSRAPNVLRISYLIGIGFLISFALLSNGASARHPRYLILEAPRATVHHHQLTSPATVEPLLAQP